MRKFMTIWHREMTACFLSPVAYVTMVAFLAVTGFTFWLAAFRSVGRPEPLSLLLYGADAFWLPILITVVSMRLFVEEKRSGTIETLLTSPVSELEIVLGKFAGAFSFLLLVLAPTVTSVFIMERLSPALSLENLDIGALVAGGIMLVLVAGALLSVAVVVSLTTQNQIVAAVSTFCAIWLLLVAGWVLGETPRVPKVLADAVSVTEHIESSARGVITSGPIVLYVSLTVFMLFLATRMLESRRWR